MSNWILKNVWFVGWIAAIPVVLIALNSLIDLPEFFVLVSAVSLWLFCLIIAGSASRFDSLALEERQELRESRLQLAKLESELSTLTRQDAVASVLPSEGDSVLRDEIDSLKKQICDHDDVFAEQIVVMRRISDLVPDIELQVKAVVEQVETQSATTVAQMTDVYQKSREQFAGAKEISTQLSGNNIYVSGVRDLSSLAAVLSGVFQILNEVMDVFKIHRQSNEELTLLVRRLISDSAIVSNVAGDIQVISDQANLLAVNTSIAVARAGGEDRVLNVIAEEVRKISERANFASHAAAQILASFPDSLSGISDQLDGTVSANAARIDVVATEVQRLIGAAKLSSSVLAKLVSASISTAETIALNIDQIASNFKFQGQFRLAMDTAISPLRQVGYYADESILRLGNLRASSVPDVDTAEKLTSSPHFMSNEGPLESDNPRDAALVSVSESAAS